MRAMQSPEINEIQHIFDEKIKSLGNALYADGTIIEGCAISFDSEQKRANLTEGRIFLDGLVYHVEAAALAIPDTATVQIGIWKKSKSVTEFEDNTLFDPAKGTPQYHMPGGYRIVTTAEWGLSTDNEGVPFFPVYGVSDSEIVTQLHEKVNPEYLDSLARYDDHAHGHYVVEGLRVTALESNITGKQVYSISEGEAHINGYESVISHSVRLVTDEAPDLADIKSEVHVFKTETGGTATISASHTPIEVLKQILITKERTVTLTHGGYTGCTDELPDTSVFEIVDVHQGSLVFQEKTDFYFASDRISWNLPGEEPAPFSTYSVTYRHRVSVSADSSDTKQITISGAVKDSLIEVDYSYRMPRIDLIVMYKDRSVGIVRGVAHRYSPVVPSTPPEAICLAEVTQLWEGLPEVKNVAIQRVPVDTLNKMRNQVEYYDLRQIPVRVTASGFGPGEGVRVYFDSVEVNCDTKKADSSGNFTGTFTIPANIPAGTKLVELIGSVESKGYAYFTGINQKTTIIKTRIYRYKDDPLAQTFTLSESRLISGVDFWLAKKGSSNIRVEIRNVSLGYPTTETLASKIIQVNNLIANNWNRAIFDTPVFLNSDTEYAITILSDTSDHEVGITEIGDWDSSKGWVRSQAYSTGVLLSSSNASTWTAHQNADLAFRLLAANFTGNSKTLDLGTFDLTGVTDIMPLAEVETTSSDTYVTFILKQNNTEVARMQAWQVISFDTALNGVYKLEAELSGSAKYSPVLGRYPQLLTSKLKSTGNYVSRAFTCGQNKQVMISTDEYAPHGSSIDIYIQDGENSYSKVDVSESVEIGSGWIQRKRFVSCNLGSTRLKIELRGSAEARHLVQSISAVVLDA
ncbi:MAG: DUF4815 domain-containing protein [Synergistaceae bacterium]|nr:DUF4815 domain-containing protein [Synergistaceae bacterium]